MQSYRDGFLVINWNEWEKIDFFFCVCVLGKVIFLKKKRNGEMLGYI